MAVNAFFLGAVCLILFIKFEIYLECFQIGTAAKMNLVLTLISSLCVIGMAEGMSLAHSVGIKANDLYNILRECPFTSGNPFLTNKARSKFINFF